MGRDFAQVTLLVFVHWLPGVVSAEQLILVPLSLVCKGFWEKKAQRSQQPTGRAISCGTPSSLNHKLLDLVETIF